MEKSRLQSVSILSIIGFFIIMLGIVVIMTLKNTADLRGILEDSVKAQLISTSIAARGILDVEKFDSYNAPEDIESDAEAYARTLADLRSLQKQVGAKYIYALKQLNGKYYFVFDTDPEIEERFIEYEIFPVHEQAFLGRESADIMNVTDEYGSFNTSAVPIWKNGSVIGIISTDIEDAFIQKSNSTAHANAVFLIVTMFVTMCAMLIIVALLLRHIRKIQDRLFRMANYDLITGLPNRQYLMDYLTKISAKSKKAKATFALLFIDLDNFKRVNDNAGHDAGDELLRHIAAYLDNVHENSKSFRPSAGILNISARIGGDEFVQIVPGVGTEAEAEIVAKKVLDNFRSQLIDRFIEKYQVGLSIGVAVFPYHTDNFNVLIKYADIAMYCAKNDGKNTYRVYNDEMGRKNEK